RLIGAVAEHRVCVGELAERSLRGCAPDRLERGDHDALEDLEHVVARRKRQLEVELPEFELSIRTQILVTPARRDLVVAVEPADHERLLEQLWRLCEREKSARLQTDGNEEVACTLRR